MGLLASLGADGVREADAARETDAANVADIADAAWRDKNLSRAAEVLQQGFAKAIEVPQEVRVARRYVFDSWSYSARV